MNKLRNILYKNKFGHLLFFTISGVLAIILSIFVANKNGFETIIMMIILIVWVAFTGPSDEQH